MTTSIRPWREDDLEVVRSILWKTWNNSYSSFIPHEDLLFYFNEQCSLKKLEEQYHDENTIGFIADYDDIPAGCEKTYYNEKEHRLYVQQLYVLSAYQNLGLGRKLMVSAAERAQALGFKSVWLGVMVQNEPAIAWYKKMGYEVVERVPFTMGNTTVDHLIGFVPVGRILTGDR